MRFRYHDYVPELASPVAFAPTAAVTGRTVAGPGLVLGDYSILRADGHHVRVGRNGWFGARATVHIAHEVYGASIGDDVTVGHFGLVHACTVEQGTVVAAGATVMDGSVVGAYALIAPGALIPPRKQLPGGFLYAGNPASPVREIGRDEVEDVARAIRGGASMPLCTWDELPPLDNAGFVDRSTNEVVQPFNGVRPALAPRAFVAPSALLVGDVRMEDDATVFYGCVLAAGGARIVVGEGSNVQDNTLIVTDRSRGDLVIGKRVTIGHNVRMGSGTIGDDSLVGMASIVGDGVVVEPGACIAAGARVAPGTVVKSGWIYGGSPARAFREIRPADRAAFASAAEIYVEYGAAYRAAGEALAA